MKDGPFVTGRHGLEMPALGLGTWRMGESAGRRDQEVAALRLGLDLGVRLIDTAEMYGDGGAEEVVSEAIAGRRDDLLLVSKVLPHNASGDGTLQAAERSLRRLRTDRIDLYLLHWPGPHPLEETYAAFESLRRQGKIRHYGVSNFDTDAMERSEALEAGGTVVANQVLYNLSRRGIERGLLPWCRRRGVVVMAYSPLEQARLAPRDALRTVAVRHGCTELQVALAWTIREPGVVTIPKASHADHVRDNVSALDLRLTAEDLDDLDRAYPAPDRDVPLETL
jgi:diketogulonate reductase-like aldo/keto reductase